MGTLDKLAEGRLIFGLGLSQVLITATVITLIARWIGWNWETALVAGCAFSLSSTAFVLQLLAQRKELMSPQGRAGFATLLFQDVAVIPMLIMVTVLANPEGTSDGSPLIALGLGAAVVVGFIAIGRLVLRPILRVVAAAQVPEAWARSELRL